MLDGPSKLIFSGKYDRGSVAVAGEIVSAIRDPLESQQLDMNMVESCKHVIR